MNLEKITNTEIGKKEVNNISLDNKEVNNLIGASVSKSTLKTYSFAVAKFQSFCSARSIQNLGTGLIQYVKFMIDNKNKYNTIKLHIAAVKFYLAELNISFDNFELKKLLKSISNNLEQAQKEVKQAKSMSIEKLVSIYENLSIRDKLIFSLSFFGAFRVSELININIEDIQKTSYGFSIEVKKSKNLKAGETAIKQFKQIDSILCPVKALNTYLREYNLKTGVLIRSINKSGVINSKGISRQAVSQMIKKYGLNEFSTHSFRRGFIVEATKRGATINNIMQQSNHKTAAMVIHYARQESKIENNAVNLF